MVNCVFENGNKASLRHAVVDVLVLKENKILLVKRMTRLLEGESGVWLEALLKEKKLLKAQLSGRFLKKQGIK